MKNLSSSVLLLILGAGLLSSAGCQTEGAKPPLHATKHDLENRSNFVLLDRATQRSVTCSLIQKHPLEDGRLEVAANIRNRENRRIQVQVRCEFKDEQWFAVDETPWQTLILSENEQNTLRFASMNNKAREFTIKVRQAR